jgi:hypothetical protein
MRRFASTNQLAGTAVADQLLKGADKIEELQRDVDDAHQIIRESLAAKEALRLRSVLLQLDLALEGMQKVTREALADAPGS